MLLKEHTARLVGQGMTKSRKGETMKLYKIDDGEVEKMRDCKGIDDCDWTDTVWVLAVSPEKALTLASLFDASEITYDNHVCPYCGLVHAFLF